MALQRLDSAKNSNLGLTNPSLIYVPCRTASGFPPQRKPTSEMGKGKQDSKAADKGSGGKGGGKGKEKEKDSKPKGAMSINVRHILVRFPVRNSELNLRFLFFFCSG